MSESRMHSQNIEMPNRIKPSLLGFKSFFSR